MDYNVKRDGDLYVVTGDIPITDSECLATCWSATMASPVHDWMLAEAMGASMVIGSRQACNARRIELGLPSLDAKKGERTANTANSQSHHEEHSYQLSSPPRADVL